MYKIFFLSVQGELFVGRPKAHQMCECDGPKPNTSIHPGSAASPPPVQSCAATSASPRRTSPPPTPHLSATARWAPPSPVPPAPTVHLHCIASLPPPPSPSNADDSSLDGDDPTPAAEMNAFRLAGDMTHLLSVVVLLLKIHTIKSCAGNAPRRGPKSLLLLPPV